MLDQAFAFAIILGTMGLLIWGRIRYDLVALLALLTSVACGIVKPDQAFSGFSDDIVIIVGSALVVSAAIGRSGLVETLMKPLVPRMRTSGMQVAVLASAVTALSAFMKNIGALAIFIPIALQVARRTEKPPSRVLMPLASGSLLGGIITLIGTSPNIIVSRMREQITGEPFRMFDFAPVGVCLAVAGVAFLTVGWRLLPKIKGAGATPETRFSVEDYVTEVRLPATSPCVGKTVRELETLGDGDVTVAVIIREGYRRYVPAGYWPLFEGDILVLEADTHALSRLVNAAKLELIHGDRGALGNARPEELAVVEAVVTANSHMIGSTVEQLALRERYGLNLLALSRSGRRIAQRLRRVRFQDGDLLVLQGRAERINDKLAALGCLPLAERNVPLGRPRNLYLPAVILGVAMVLVTSGAVSVPLGFFGAAVAVLVFQLLTISGSVRGRRVAGADPVRSTHPGERGPADHGRHRARRRLAFGRGATSARARRSRADTACGDGADAVSQQCRDRPGDGADRSQPGGQARVEPRPLPHGGRDRRRLRFPHADRAPVQYAGDGTRWLPLRRLLAPWPAAVSHRGGPWNTSDQLLLAAALKDA